MQNIFILVVLVSFVKLTDATIYNATWASIDSRPLPVWFDEAKFGIFNHWGVYSAHGLPAWFWYEWKGSKEAWAIAYMKNNYAPDFTYADFGPQFKAEFFDPNQFANVIKRSGAKYYVLTSKHHDGFALWHSKYAWNWNSMDVGPNKDLVGELRAEFNKLGGVHFGLYFSQFEFMNPLYLQDKKNRFKTNDYIKMVSQPQLHEIVESYKPDVIWSDGDWEAYPDYWNSTHFLAWLYNYSPVKDTVVTNDRWGNGTKQKHGGYYSGRDNFDPGKLQNHKWESATVLNNAGGWSWRATMVAGDVKSTATVLSLLARTVSCGGNLLLNVGPTGFGRIQPIFEERLAQIGDWLKTNGEAIYGTKPWIYQNDTAAKIVWYTSKVRSDQDLKADRIFNPQTKNNTIVYAIVTTWPKDGILKLKQIKTTAQTTMSMLGYDGSLSFKPHPGSVEIALDTIPWTKLPSFDAWVIRMEFLQTDNRNPLAEEAENEEQMKQPVPETNKLFE